MLLRHSLGLEVEADAVDSAVRTALSDGHRTADLAAAEGESLTTGEFSDIMMANLHAPA
jgi:3-isopropylmalate dehydrogenase